ncbi:hypothetical protein PRK78_004088 [Emydomyces testavorans]|uniref:F-box domain-containing protein n=1 Tax=Emydomyces testavorans TaxID=2070801 RepID=A0AAF0DHF4_9EURO|nr:hypothetical protein PRK78_004088 [Emydomyces testavorans]
MDPSDNQQEIHSIRYDLVEIAYPNMSWVNQAMQGMSNPSFGNIPNEAAASHTHNNNAADVNITKDPENEVATRGHGNPADINVTTDSADAATSEESTRVGIYAGVLHEDGGSTYDGSLAIFELAVHDPLQRGISAVIHSRLPQLRTLMDDIDNSPGDTVLTGSNRIDEEDAPNSALTEGQIERAEEFHSHANRNNIPSQGLVERQPSMEIVTRNPAAQDLWVQDIPTMYHQFHNLPRVTGDSRMASTQGSVNASNPMQFRHRIELSDRGHRSSRNRRDRIFAFFANPMIFSQVSIETQTLPANETPNLDTLPSDVLERIFEKLDGASQVCLALTAKVLGRATYGLNDTHMLFYNGVERQQLLCWRLGPSIPTRLKLCYIQVGGELERRGEQQGPTVRFTGEMPQITTSKTWRAPNAQPKPYGLT